MVAVAKSHRSQAEIWFNTFQASAVNHDIASKCKLLKASFRQNRIKNADLKEDGERKTAVLFSFGFIGDDLVVCLTGFLQDVVFQQKMYNDGRRACQLYNDRLSA